MRFTNLLPLAIAATAFVFPDEETLNRLPLQNNKAASIKDNAIASIDQAISRFIGNSKDSLDDAIAIAMKAEKKAKRAKKARKNFRCHDSFTAFDVQSWLDSPTRELPVTTDETAEHPHHPPHHGHKPNLTVYELIAKSKYTTKLAALINDDDELVKILNGTEANYTVFAPVDKAFEKLHKPHKKPSKEIIRSLILHHVSPDFYPAGRVLVTHTIPTALKEKELGDQPQRLRVGLGFKGLEINFDAAIIAINIFGSNGVIHGVDKIILPPFETTKILEILPGEFSTLTLGLEKTGLLNDFKNTAQAGGTFFAPSNFAFKKLGPRINAFLFSSHGEKYLKGLLKYHVVSNQTLYSDAYYPDKEAESTRFPKGLFHVDLPTLLDDHSLSIDIFRYGGFIRIKINGFATVTIQDGVAKDGVIHVVSDVLIPPKKIGSEQWKGEELTVEDLMDRLSPFVDDQIQGEEL